MIHVRHFCYMGIRMNKKQDKINIVKTIIKAAADYKNNMVGRSFLYVFEGRYIEVVYRARDFLHLTGVDTKLSANEFYKEAIRGTLRHTQIFFSKRHPYDLCIRKMVHLAQITAVTDSAIFMLENLVTDTFRYKFGLSELNFSVCLDADRDVNQKIVSDHYIARSLRVEDSFDRSSGAYEVQYIFVKPNDARLYSTVTYADHWVEITDLPDEVLAKLHPMLLR